MNNFKKEKNNLIFSIIVMALSFILFTTSVFAWFAYNKNKTIDKLNVTITSTALDIVKFDVIKNGNIIDDRVFSGLFPGDVFILEITLKNLTTRNLLLDFYMKGIICDTFLSIDGLETLNMGQVYNITYIDENNLPLNDLIWISDNVIVKEKTILNSSILMAESIKKYRFKLNFDISRIANKIGVNGMSNKTFAFDGIYIEV